MEIMIETTQSIINYQGENTVPLLVAAAGSRCRSAIFGTYDYTASCNITAAHQNHTHPACDFARHVMQVSLAGTGITISDGATTSMPIGPHKAAKGRAADGAADGREPHRGARRLEASLRQYHALSAARLLPGMGFESGAITGALCRHRHFLPEQVCRMPRRD
jgi:hypothetical protein